MTQASIKPVIAVDIDDVLFPFVHGITDYHNTLKGANLTVDDFFSYDFAEVWGVSAEETEEIVSGFLRADQLHLQPVDGAASALARLAGDFDIVLVTARNQVFEAETAAWLRRHLPDLFQHVVFAGNPHDGRPYRPKGVICRELGARYLIDDYPANLLSAAECGVKGILFGSKRWSVLDEPSALIAPCADWRAVEEYIYHEK